MRTSTAQSGSGRAEEVETPREHPSATHRFRLIDALSITALAWDTHTASAHKSSNGEYGAAGLVSYEIEAPYWIAVLPSPILFVPFHYPASFMGFCGLSYDDSAVALLLNTLEMYWFLVLRTRHAYLRDPMDLVPPMDASFSPAILAQSSRRVPARDPN
jgi:hypothetical protein